MKIYDDTFLFKKNLFHMKEYVHLHPLLNIKSF